MRLIVYAVIVSFVDDILSSDLYNIFPTAESAVAAAKEIAKSPSVYRVDVDQDEVTEEFGRGWLATVYIEKHEERY